MARFFGALKGARGPTTRLGHTGLAATAASWSGAIKTELSVRDGKDYYRVVETDWPQNGTVRRVLAEGFFGEADDE